MSLRMLSKYHLFILKEYDDSRQRFFKIYLQCTSTYVQLSLIQNKTMHNKLAPNRDKSKTNK